MLGEAEKIEALTSSAISSAIIKCGAGVGGWGLHSEIKQALGKMGLSQTAACLAKTGTGFIGGEVENEGYLPCSCREERKTGRRDLKVSALGPPGSPAAAKCKIMGAGHGYVVRLHRGAPGHALIPGVSFSFQS